MDNQRTDRFDDKISRASEEEKQIFDRDSKFFLYQDGLMWTRFQTAAVIEGAMLYGLYQLTPHLQRPDKIALVLCGSGLVLIIGILALKDNSDALGHLDRIRQFEDRFGRPFVWRSWPRSLRGIVLVRIMIGIMVGLNLWLIYRVLISSL